MIKTIYLQPEDNSKKVWEKITASKSKKILIVIPSGSDIFKTEELKKLFSKISDANIDATLVSNSDIGLSTAKNIGFKIKSSNIKKTESSGSKSIKIIYKKGKAPSNKPVIKPKAKAPEKTKSSPNPKSKPSLLSQIIFGFLTVLSIIVIISVFYLVVPTTNITITTQVDSIPVDYIISLDTTQKSIDFINNVIPAQTIAIDEELSQEARATGQKNEGTPAGGIITVYNNSQTDLPLVANTRFISTGDILFRSNSQVTIKAGGSAQVNVTADQSGSIGNIGPSKFYLPALPGSESYYYGQSSSSMSGGTDNIVYFVSSDDINYSTDEIRQSLYNKAVADLTNKLPAGRKYLAQNIADLEINTSTTAKEGDQMDTFDIDAKTTVSFLVYDEKDMKDITSNNLSKKISKERVFVANGLDQMKTNIKEFNIKEGRALINITANALSAPLYNTDLIKNQLTGMTKEQVKEYFLQYPEIQQIDIYFWPDWVNRVSKIPSRITIDIVW